MLTHPTRAPPPRPPPQIFECDELCPDGKDDQNGKCPPICKAIEGYPTFCCPGDDTCSKDNNVDVGYAAGYFKTIVADAQAKCTSQAKAIVPKACMVNATRF